MRSLKHEIAHTPVPHGHYGDTQQSTIAQGLHSAAVFCCIRATGPAVTREQKTTKKNVQQRQKTRKTHPTASGSRFEPHSAACVFVCLFLTAVSGGRQKNVRGSTRHKILKLTIRCQKKRSLPVKTYTGGFLTVRAGVLLSWVVLEKNGQLLIGLENSRGNLRRWASGLIQPIQRSYNGLTHTRRASCSH